MFLVQIIIGLMVVLGFIGLTLFLFSAIEVFFDRVSYALLAIVGIYVLSYFIGSFFI